MVTGHVPVFSADHAAFLCSLKPQMFSMDMAAHVWVDLHVICHGHLFKYSRLTGVILIIPLALKEWVIPAEKYSTSNRKQRKYCKLKVKGQV